MKNSKIFYSVGALLYCPANNTSISDTIMEGKFGTHYSLALCLEDTINDNFVEEAEEILICTLKKIWNYNKRNEIFIPKIFIRVRYPHQIKDLLVRLDCARQLVKGFVIPKFSLENADVYINQIISANEKYEEKFYMMPIMESPTIINLESRYEILYALKDKLDSIDERVLNIRVGGNDLCKAFGFRRHSNESIHDIRPVSNIFSDIVTAFGTDYIVSGPVWEYYNGDNWSEGLKSEVRDDILCGFIGKTVIHPKQIEIVHNSYKVSRKDLDDANAVLNWDNKNQSFVSGNVTKERMNEYKTHLNWAIRTTMLAEVYGITDATDGTI